MPEPLVEDAIARAAVSDLIDSRIGNYHWQRQRALNSGDRYGHKLGGILIDELLDIRNAILGVPNTQPMATRKRLKRQTAEKADGTPPQSHAA